MATAAAESTFAGTDRFTPKALLGRGSMGVVYRVFDGEMDTDVALKTLPSRDAEQLYHLKQEFRALAGIVHPNLVDLYELVVNDRECFFTMELIDGVNFIDYVRPAGQLNLERFVAATRRLVDGLATIHAAGKLHRDVKPSNVLVSPDGRVVLLDFGLATALGVEQDGSGCVGTLDYMPPEQILGHAAHPTADWYSIGVMLYEALTGRLPFAAPAARLLQAKLRGAPAPVAADVPEALATLVGALIDPDPSRRPASSETSRVLDLLSFRSERPLGEGQGQAESSVYSIVTSDMPFVGRTAELARLRSAFEAVCRGETAVVHIVGASGIGKSELVRRFLASIETAGDVLVLRGRCHPQEAVPYKAVDRVVDALSRVLLACQDAGLPVPVPEQGSALTRLFPVLERVPAFAQLPKLYDAVEPHEIRRRGFVALRELLGQVACQRPLVVWIDDLQWGDLDSSVLLRELLRPPGAPAMLLLLSYRSEDRASIPLPDADGTEYEPSRDVTQEIALGPLDEATTRELATQLCATRIGADRHVAEIAAEAGGSPFFVGELARVVGSQPGSTALRLADVMSRRLHQLPATARDVLEVVSVAGGALTRSVALNAAGIGERGRAIIGALEQRSLLRTTTLDEHIAVEVYHDRIREALLATLPAEVLQSHHGALADVLAAQPEPDPSALFRHCLGAQRREAAAEWGVQAADRAANVLAFIEAAELYGQALELKRWETSAATTLQIRRADALVNAGRCAEAAPLYRTAATTTAEPASLDLRRRAAAQFLISGRIDDGVAELRSLLDALGLTFPRSPRRALFATLGCAGRLFLRGLNFRPQDESALTPTALTRLDTCHDATKGLINVDTVRGSYFALQSLALALQAGERKRVARALATVGGGLVASGTPLQFMGRSLIDRAQRIADGEGDPYLLAIMMIVVANDSLVSGRWQEMLARCDAAVELLKGHCRGMTSEVDTARMVALRALEELGNVPEVLSRAQRLLEEAADAGDLYAQVTARLNTAFWQLAAGDAGAARAESQRAIGLWTHRTYSMQHFYAARVEACCDLYEGELEQAQKRTRSMWAKLTHSGLLRNGVVWSDAHLLRARVALASAQSEGSRHLLKLAERDAQRLLRGRQPHVVVHARFIQAGVAAARGDRSRAQALLQDVIEGYERTGAVLNAACARRRLAENLPDERGRVLVRQADDMLCALGIRDPERWLAIQSPGFGR